MKLGIVIEETWDFFNEIYAELEEVYQIELFKRRASRLPFFRNRTNRFLYRRDIQKLMQDNDVVFFEWASHLLAAATQFPKTCGIVARLHRYEMYQWADRINWDPVDKVIVVSEAKKHEFIDRYPTQASKIVVIYPGVDTKKYQLIPKVFSGEIGILCHLSPRKRVYDLILAFDELLKLRDDFRLHIAGASRVSHADYFYAINYIVRELQLEEKVIFYGNVEDSWNWYPQIDIFISNSYSEGLQVAPMEAMASGCYCFSHHWSGARELLPEENLFYGSGELIEKIISYRKTSEEEKQIQRGNMRAIACEKFDIELITRQIRRVIDEAMAGSG